jgi:hypothetical protein
MFNRSIYKMIDAFTKIRPIFQPLHFKDFMDPTDAMYNLPLHEKT